MSGEVIHRPTGDLARLWRRLAVVLEVEENKQREINRQKKSVRLKEITQNE